METKINENQPAPNFTLPSVTSHATTKINLQDYRGQYVVLYFYPKDDTSGCTSQAVAFRDLLKQFTALNAVIFGVSKDSIKSHDDFIAKYNLNFPLLADETTQTCQAYGVWVEKSMYGRKYMGIERSTFLINPEGIISHIWRKVKVVNHGNKILEILRKPTTLKS